MKKESEGDLTKIHIGAQPKIYVGAHPHNFYLAELMSLEFMAKNNLELTINNIKMDAKSDLVVEGGANAKKKIDAWQLNIVKKENPLDVIYTRSVDGNSEETKAYCIYFSYKDIINSGLQFLVLINDENKRAIEEMKLRGKEAFKDLDKSKSNLIIT